MSKLNIVVLSLLSLLSACVGVLQNGQCDVNIQVQTNFDLTRYMGVWYDIESYDTNFQTGTCNTATYSLSGGVVNVQNTQVVNERLDTIIGTAVPTPGNPAGTPKFTVSFPTGTGGAVTATNYWVLSTDYDTYALVYSCRNVGDNQRDVYSWKLGRAKGPLPAAATNAINTIIANVQALNPQSYVARSHTANACFYYPEYVDLPSTIELPGLCDTSITGIPNFNAADYLGTWIEIARYPQTTQTGQCNRANYGAGTGGAVSVLNSQVISEELLTIEGTARVASTDGSGQLAVTFNIDGVDRTSNLYVLATDYTSYALAYSCANTADGNRRVGSWKLSRTTTLSEAANTAINAVITATQGLNQDYYLTTSQTDASCFYYPKFDIDNPPSTIELPGLCDTSITGIPNFNAADYLGTWIEIARYPQTTQTGQCNRANYAAGTAGAVSVLNSQVISEELLTIEGTATVASTDGSGQLAVTFNIGGVDRTSNLYVLATDYTSYALAYSCANTADGNRRVGSWKLSRTTTLSEAANTAINAVISSTQGLNQDYYLTTSQTDASCFYYPKFDTDNPPSTIELPGLCDTSITGIPNFNAADYLGTWIEIARYPQTTQTGQCNRANYGAGTGGAVSVLNSQVISEELLTIEGTARVASTDGSGQLAVTFNIGGVDRTSNLYVLATDYTSYALAYSCANTADGNRRVGSWKLSRTTSLSEAANTAINAVISSTQGLNQDYYLTTSQTDASCFYYPKFDIDNPPSTIELPGLCDTSITGIPNFNAADYLGTWIEIARYPQTTQTGQCNRANYGASTDGSVSVLNSQVISEELLTIEGEARVTSTDGSGQLAVTFNIGGQDRTSNLYVLATDYTSYALAYSCANIPGNRRRVGSWKLSRTTTLSEAANTAINAVISSTQGLNQDYYLTTSQTAASCFYYPQFENPSFIELPGQCDTSITGVPNFNAANYLGTWIEIARYPQTTQAGQCSRATYALGATGGTVSVVNSQVISEELLTQTGEATVASTDGSGQLEVTFVVNGETRTSNYYILATDYTSYALVYSCANTPDGNRRVGSWKLSRTTTLSSAANTAINTAISSTQGLNENYYQTTSQTDGTCFYYPAQSASTVVIPGQCDDTISVVQNIDMTRFASGSWYQIQRYDAIVDGLSCVGASLSYDEESRETKVIAYQAINEELSVAEGVAKPTATDGRGEFVLTMPGADSDASSTETTIKILATDYDGYAIAYSCRNVGSSLREVRAWQLSRQRTMTAAGTQVVANLIQNRQEFYLPYFKAITHLEECPEPSSAFLMKSSIIVIFVCFVLQLVR